MDHLQFEIDKIALSVPKGTQVCEKGDTDPNLAVNNWVVDLIVQCQGKGERFFRHCFSAAARRIRRVRERFGVAG
jgi:hypothetical protein